MTPADSTHAAARSGSAAQHPFVTLSRRDGVATVTLQRPSVNAINERMLTDLYAAHAALLSWADIGAVVVRSRQRMFSPGVDIRMIHRMLTASDDGPEVMAGFGRRLQDFCRVWQSLPIPTIAAMAGIATGGGLEFALACDLRVANVDARYGLPEARIGLIPGAGGTQRLTQLAGPGVAARLIFTGELVTGAVARELGIVQFAENGDDVEAHAMRLAAELALGNHGTMRAIKTCLAAAPSEAGYAAELAENRRLFGAEQVRSKLLDFIETRRRRADVHP